MNESGLKPLGRCVLVEPYTPEVTETSIPGFTMLKNDREIGHMLEMRARVVAVGPACWPDEPARCAPGDLVLISKMSGALVEGVKDGKQYRAVNDRDVFLGIEE